MINEIGFLRNSTNEETPKNEEINEKIDLAKKTFDVFLKQLQKHAVKKPEDLREALDLMDFLKELFIEKNDNIPEIINIFREKSDFYKEKNLEKDINERTKLFSKAELDLLESEIEKQDFKTNFKKLEFIDNLITKIEAKKYIL